MGIEDGARGGGRGAVYYGGSKKFPTNYNIATSLHAPIAEESFTSRTASTP